MTQPGSIPREWIEACARALYEFCPTQDQAVDPDNRPTSKPFDIPWEAIVECGDDKYFYDAARAAIAILRPLIEAETRERCAQIAEKFAKTSEETMFRLPDSYSRDRIESRMLEARSIASALRAEGK